MLPPSIPIFPLPNVVMFPNVVLPLHIFEPRYRQMVHRALDGDRLIGMVLLRPGYESDYEGAPAIYRVGCAGSMTHVERLPDGRFNIVLKGVTKFRVEREEPPTDDVLFRTAHVTPVAEDLAERDHGVLQERRSQLESRLAPLFTAAGSTNRLPEILSDEDLINALAQYLALEPIEKQALLELDGPVARAQALMELLEMKALTERVPGDGGLVH